MMPNKLVKLCFIFAVLTVSSAYFQKRDSLSIPGISYTIIKNGEIVIYNHTGLANLGSKIRVIQNTLFDFAPLSKTLFAYFVLKMASKVIIDLDKPLYEYLINSDFEQEVGYKRITKSMLLTHSSGLPNWRFLENDGNLSIAFEPDTNFKYSGEGYEYFAHSLANNLSVTKDESAQHVDTDVFSPLTMALSHTVWNDIVENSRVSGHQNGRGEQGWGSGKETPGFFASYSLQTTADDYAKLLMTIM